MSDIRKAFVSRWAGGYILELDFSQLEIYALAFLSGDKQLKADLLSGADLHGISATNLFGKHYTPNQRKIAKTLSFQLQYGAGAKSMAKTNNIDEKIARKFIELYYARYKGVDEWQKNVAREVAKNRVPASASGQRTPSGNPAASSTIVTATGRRYYFQEQDAPDWTDFDTTFSPTQMKNFPVQGFATGDIVPLVLGKIHLYMANNHELWGNLVRLINTVHDSVVFD
jgi:DNA polymerase-1